MRLAAARTDRPGARTIVALAFAAFARPDIAAATVEPAGAAATPGLVRLAAEKRPVCAPGLCLRRTRPQGNLVCGPCVRPAPICPPGLCVKRGGPDGTPACAPCSPAVAR